MKRGLSVHLMVKNPPIDRLALLVNYLSALANEFVIVDTGSSDEDKSIMSSWPTVRIIEEEFTNFSATRNKGLEQHQYEWTLGIDPDELPSVGMMAHISAVLNYAANRPQALGWAYWTINFWGGVKGPEMPYHWHCRMWKSEAGRLYRPVHELVSLNGAPESETRGSFLMPLAPAEAYLIHSKAKDELKVADELYERLGGISR